VSRLRPVRLKQEIIYGPVQSRRLGRSLGINLLGAGRKICTFDCLYCQLRQPRTYDFAPTEQALCSRRCVICQYSHPDLNAALVAGHSLPSVEDVVEAVASAIESDPNLDSLTLSGNGEPTTYPAFEEVVAALVDLRNTLCPGTPLTMLSNVSLAAEASIHQASRKIDVLILKLDAGDEATFQTLNRPCPGVNLGDIVSGIVDLGSPFVLQTMFVGGERGNVAASQLAAWLEMVALTRPARMQIYSLDRVPADSGLHPVAKHRLHDIARQVVSRTETEIGVY
jgi:wyosine [tRNA(Phe)-imidazoG37] synthetase (radical SAM superfamily)